MRPGCAHPREQREAVHGRGQGGKVRCGACGKVFTPRGAPVVHGTYRGYAKHRRLRDGGAWAYPPARECGCLEAGTEYRRQNSKKPANEKLRKQRGMARQRALSRLRQSYPYLYAEFYAREIHSINGEAELEPRIPVWDDLVRRLVKETMGKDEAALCDALRTRTATAHERECMRLVGRIRIMLGERYGVQ